MSENDPQPKYFPLTVTDGPALAVLTYLAEVEKSELGEFVLPNLADLRQKTDLARRQVKGALRRLEEASRLPACLVPSTGEE